MNTNPHIVIADDDKEICSLLEKFLTKHQMSITTVNNGADLMKQLTETNSTDMVILDLMLPDTTGIELCKKIRAQFPHLPIIMLTAMDEDTDKIIGLEIGADDYMTKPFNQRELLARIKAVLRRFKIKEYSEEEMSSDYHGQILKFSGWTLNTASRELLSPDNIEVILSSKNYDLLLAFLERPRRVLNRDQLLTILSNRMSEPFDRSIDVQVSRLRQKLGDDPRNPAMIKTVRTGGYFFAAKVSKA